jgi:lysophospholipase L1-like esterase
LNNSNWRVIGRILIKAGLFFLGFNLLFAFSPAWLGRLSLYNHVLPGRPRLPYGEDPAQSYNLSLYDLDAMVQSHLISQPKAADEFRVVLLGDSGVWGWLLENEDTLAGQLNQAGFTTRDGRRVVVYNLGYPLMSLSKDLLLLHEALPHQPDLILWLVTLQSFPWEKQLEPPLLHHNPDRFIPLIEQLSLPLDAADPRFVHPTPWQQTIIGQRQPLADWLRLQLYGVSWAATGVDQAIPTDIPLRQSDFAADLSWLTYPEPTPLDEEGLALSLLQAGVRLAGEVPVWIINEPIFLSQGENSDLRYNAWYPRWAYDEYREQLGKAAAAQGWFYLDLWDAVPPAEFTDSPVHLTPVGAAVLAETVMAEIKRLND